MEQRKPSHPVPLKEGAFGEPVDIDLGSPYAVELGFDGIEPYNEEAAAATAKANTESTEAEGGPPSKKKKKKKRKKK